MKVCLRASADPQTPAVHFHCLRRVPALGALAGGEPGFGATVMPSYSQAHRPQGKRKLGPCGAQWAPSVFQRSLRSSPTWALGVSSGRRWPYRWGCRAVHLGLGNPEAAPGASAARGCHGRAGCCSSGAPAASDPRGKREILGICDPGRETLWHTSLLLPCLWAFCY